MSATDAMRVDPAAPEDARAIAEVHVASWQAAYKDMLPAQYLADLSVAERETRWRASIEREHPECLVARSGTKVVGFVSFAASRDEGAAAGCAEIWAFYLAPAVWSQGAGRMLWQSALGRIADAGYTSVSLWVVATNERAIRFYRGAGFVPDPGSLKEFTLGGVRLQEVRYVYREGPWAPDCSDRERGRS